MFDQVGIRREQQPKIVAITCLIEKEFVNKAYKSGIDKLIPKPLPIEQFGQLLKKEIRPFNPAVRLQNPLHFQLEHISFGL